jgi:hypothetical protein
MKNLHFLFVNSYRLKIKIQTWKHFPSNENKFSLKFSSKLDDDSEFWWIFQNLVFFTLQHFKLSVQLHLLFICVRSTVIRNWDIQLCNFIDSFLNHCHSD